MECRKAAELRLDKSPAAINQLLSFLVRGVHKASEYHRYLMYV